MLDTYELERLERLRDELSEPPSKANNKGYEMVAHNNWCVKTTNKVKFLQILEDIKKIKEMS